jgi:hypothetical protein
LVKGIDLEMAQSNELKQLIRYLKFTVDEMQMTTEMKSEKRKNKKIAIIKNFDFLESFSTSLWY